MHINCSDVEVMRKEESMLLGQILRKADINLTAYGIDVEELVEGKRDISYEEIQNVLGKNPATHMLSINLKEELKSSKLQFFNHKKNVSLLFYLLFRTGGRNSLQRSNG